MKKKIYRIPPPKDIEPLPSETAIHDLEKKLRMASGGYYEEIPKDLPEEKSWEKRKRPGIIMRFKKVLLPQNPKRKTPIT